MNVVLMRERRVLDALKPQKNQVVLEIGFGRGKLLGKLAPLVNRVMGVEINEELVTRASQRLQFENLELKKAPAEDLPFEDASFDAVICSFSYHEFSDGTKALKEIWRVLKPLGRVVIVDPSKDSFFVRKFSKMAKGQQMRTFAELRKELLLAGFSDIIGERYRMKLLLKGMWLEGTKQSKRAADAT
ncbi:MAG: class I SAM-dependent methyltransferase [Candidatus Heimdallarchaeota archaeon]